MSNCVSFWILFVCGVAVLPTGLQARCDAPGQCQGQRPRSREGCCPLLPGDECGDEIEAVCDADLGYNCKGGTCKGSHNLSVSAVETTTATVSWLAFLPEGSKLEYIVLYTRTLSLPLAKWSLHGVGNHTHVTLRFLTPARLYYVRVGVWADGKPANFSETLFFHTKAVSHCYYNGRYIAATERLVVECEESCVCFPTGRFECVPVCRKGDIETPACTDGRADECCDSVPHCLFNNCTYLGDTVPHALTWTIDCQENCTCYDGFVTCTPLCEEPRVPECADQAPVKAEEGCCTTWRCEDKEETCSFRNTTYTEGTWIYDDCEMCTCDSTTGNVDCMDLANCDTPEIPETTETCQSPTIINNLCCSQVYCEQDQNLDGLLEVFSVKSLQTPAALVRFKLTSPTNERDISNVVLSYSKQQTRNTHASWENISFSLSDVGNISNMSVELGDFQRKTGVYRVLDDYVIILSGLEQRVFYYFKLQMELAGATRDNLTRTPQVFTTNMIVLKIQGLPLKHPGSFPSVSKPRKDGVVWFQASNISSSSAALAWRVPEAELANLSWFVVRYKPLTAAHWSTTPRIIFSQRTCTLTCLHEARWYQAELLAYPDERKLGTAFFNTSEITESPDERFMVKIKLVQLGTRSAKIGWKPVQDKYRDNVTTLELLWSLSDSEEVVNKLCVSPRTSDYSIDGLVPGKLYICWIRVNLHSGKSVFSSPVHFVTSTPVTGTSHSSTSHRHSIVLAVTVSSVSVISIVVAIATVTYLTRCRRRTSYHSQTSFENKIFQIYKDDREV